MAWAPGAEGPELDVVEEVARDWPDRAIVLVDRDVALERREVISEWEAAGLKMRRLRRRSGWGADGCFAPEEPGPTSSPEPK